MSEPLKAAWRGQRHFPNSNDRNTEQSHDDVGTSPRCPTEVIENKPICLCFPCCVRDLSCLGLALLPTHHVMS